MKTDFSNKVNKPKVLLIEDTKIVQKAQRLLLEEIGCSVDVAETGKEALAAYNDDYDLILTDIGLPDMRGTTVAVEIRGRKSTKRTPIIALTAYSQDQIAEECSAAGIDAIYNKPVSSNVLQEIFEKYVDTLETPKP